jgi:hypothetical protein
VWLQATTGCNETPLTDSDDSDAESDASLEALSDSSAEDERALDLDTKWRPVQLHNVAKAMRVSSKTAAQVEALNKLEPLVRWPMLSNVIESSMLQHFFTVLLAFLLFSVLFYGSLFV